MSKRYVYMDYAATTYTKPEVLSEMMPYFGKDFGNPSSVHEYGRVAKKAQEEARGKIAAAINAARENEIYFTSGGTEADNMAIMGAASASKKGKHIITSSIEHHAVLHTCQYMEKTGYEVTYLPVDQYGLVNIEDLKAAIRPDTCLITIMFANNEIGTIQPVAEIGRIARENNIVFHTDAVQAADKFVAVPRFDGVGMAELVQPDVGVHHFGHDPRAVLIRARGGRAPEHDLAERPVDGDGEAALPNFLADGVGDAETLGNDHAPGIGGPPEQRLSFAVPREDAAAVRRKQPPDGQIAADRDQPLGIGLFRIGEQFRVIGMQPPDHAPRSRLERLSVSQARRAGYDPMSTFNNTSTSSGE